MCDIPIVVITTHGVWRPAESIHLNQVQAPSEFTMPIEMTYLTATTCGVANLLDQKLANTIPILIDDIYKYGKCDCDCETIANYIKNVLFNLDRYGSRTGEHKLRQPPASMRAAEELKEQGDIEGSKYLAQAYTESYNIITIKKDDIFINKDYEIYKSEQTNNNYNRYDNRVVLYSNGKSPIDILLPWTNVARNRGKRGRNDEEQTEETTLHEILKFVNLEGHEKVVIIDLSCNTIESSGSARNYRADGRHFRKMARSSKWAGGCRKLHNWNKMKPQRGVTRRRMFNNCGQKCFLGKITRKNRNYPDFPICSRNTCKINRKDYALHMLGQDNGDNQNPTTKE